MQEFATTTKTTQRCQYIDSHMLSSSDLNEEKSVSETDVNEANVKDCDS